MSYYWRRSYEDQKYHGLINQGATCYLNSVLQVLFMTKDFREAVGRNARGNHIDVQLASLFKNLKTETAETVEVTQKLGIYRVGEQRDAAEHFEKILALTSDEAAKIFRGKLAHKTICSECNTENDDDAAFWDLPLPLVKPSGENDIRSMGESYSVEDAIQEFFRDSHFDGENQMYCDTCCDKCDATAKCVIKHHPEVLMLLLKRFEFSYIQMSFVKNDCVVDVPSTLKIPENQMYELYAFVEHFGSLHGGHYTATIKDDDEGRWYCFNDSSVTLLNNQSFQRQKTERTKSAYLLFYRKKHVIDAGIQDIREVSNNRSPTFNTSNNSEQRRGVNKRDADEEAVQSKRHKKDSEYHVRKEKSDEMRKTEEEETGEKAEAKDQIEKNTTVKRKMKPDEKEIQEKKGKTQADSLTSKTEKQLGKHDSPKCTKDRASVSVEQDLPNIHEHQRGGKIHVQGDSERMTRDNKHSLRSGDHDTLNKPHKCQDVHREGKSSRDKPDERQQKPNDWRKIDVDEGRNGGKERKTDYMSPDQEKNVKVKTNKDEKTGQREERHKSKETKEKTDADSLTSKTAKQLSKHDSSKYAKHRTSVSLEQDLPNIHEHQRDGKKHVQGDSVTRDNKHSLRSGDHDKLNKPHKSQDVHREGKSSRDKLDDGQPKQNDRRKIGGDGGRNGGKERKTDYMSPDQEKNVKVKTNKDEKTGQREERHKSKETKEKTEALRMTAKNDKHLERQTMGDLNFPKNVAVQNPSKYQDDERDQIEVGPPATPAESEHMGKQEQGAGQENGLMNSKQKKEKGNTWWRRWFKSKKVFNKPKQGAKKKKDETQYEVPQYESDNEEMEKTPGCYSFSLKRNKKRFDNQKRKKHK